MSMSDVDVLRAACCLAAVDGKITEREMPVIQKLADHAGVGQASLRAMIDRALHEPSYFEKQFEILKADPEPTLIALTGVAVSDGDLSMDQRVMLRYFADKLGLSADRFDKLMSAAEKLVKKAQEKTQAAQKNPTSAEPIKQQAQRQQQQ